MLRDQLAKIKQEVKMVKQGLDYGDIDLIREGLEEVGRMIATTPCQKKLKTLQRR
ncbi:MAG: hypothetical protein HYU02_08605 [Thaumarchaeota archaeon]|nr:hypothetical protein [Nitrososphaerota archaeon]